MKTQTAIGWLFVVIGLVILFVALGPALYALRTRMPARGSALTLLGRDRGDGVRRVAPALLARPHDGARGARRARAPTPLHRPRAEGATVSVTDTTSSSSATEPPKDAGT
jgi:hypothetical protein